MFINWICYFEKYFFYLLHVLGFAGGGWFDNIGSAAEYICLSREPVWGVYDDTNQGRSQTVYGVEYEFDYQGHRNGGERFFGQNMYEHDVPCAVCLSIRTAVVMIPGRNKCYDGWTLEYSGYLVSGLPNHPAPSNFACLDQRPEVEAGGSQNLNGKLMYLVEAECGSLACPPYVQDRELTCVVCSK